MKIEKLSAYLLLGILLCSCSSRVVISEFEGGTRYDDGGINVIELKGDWHQMGRQYGAVSQDLMLDMLAYLDTKVGNDPQKEAWAYELSDSLFNNYPAYLKDFFAGMQETSGIDMRDIKLCNAAEYAERCFFCSALAVWGDYARDKLVIGRNYDAENYSEVGRDLVLTVYHPDEGLSAATFGYAGEVYCVNGFNENGIFIELNNGMPSAGWDIDWSLCPATTGLFDLLIHAGSMQDVDDFFFTSISASSFAIGVADGQESRLYEWCRQGVKRGDTVTPEGLMINTNHYSNGEWEFPLPEDRDSWNSITRRANLLDCARKYKGSFDVERMKRVMSLTIDNGGPYCHLTRYQIIAIPSDKVLHIRPAGEENWTALDMSKYNL